MKTKYSLILSEKWLLPAILLVTLTVFIPLLWCDFINFDDPPLVTQNPYIHSGLTLDGIRWAFSTGYVANWIPLSWISHMLDVQLFGMNPAGHHLINVLFHVASTAFLFLFLNRVTRSPWQSAAATLLFALHPLHVESVAWVAERKDVLSAFFWMLTMYAYCRYVERPCIARYIAVMVYFTLGLLAKPMLVTLPIILLLLDWWPLGRFTSQEKTAHTTFLRLCAEKIPFLILSAGSSIITYLVQAAAGTVSQGYTAMARAGRVCVSYMTYLYMTIWPIDLAVIYPFSRYPPSNIIVIFSILTLLLITTLVILLRKQYPFLITGWGWYLVSLLPVIGLIQIGQHSVADRYTYIPLIGVFMIVACGVPLLAEKLLLPRNGLAIISVAVVVAMIVLTSKQITYWKNSLTLFEHAISVTKENWVAHNNLGLEYQAQGDIDRAVSHFKESIKAKPSHALAYLNLGVVHRLRNESTQALEAFKWAVMFEPGNQEARLGLALVYLDLGKWEMAMPEYEKLRAAESSYASELLREINARRDSVSGR